MLTIKEVRKINKELRAIDDSHLYPIKGRFNATDRAIRRIRKYQKEGLVIENGESYKSILENEISKIVNKEV